MTKVTRGVFSDSPHTQVSRALHGALPRIYSGLTDEDRPLVALSVRCRGVADYVVVCKRVGSDGGPQVLFGNGFDVVSALLGLEGAWAADRWRLDTPWAPDSKK